MLMQWWLQNDLFKFWMLSWAVHRPDNGHFQVANCICISSSSFIAVVGAYASLSPSISFSTGRSPKCVSIGFILPNPKYRDHASWIVFEMPLLVLSQTPTPPPLLFKGSLAPPLSFWAFCLLGSRAPHRGMALQPPLNRILWKVSSIQFIVSPMGLSAASFLGGLAGVGPCSGPPLLITAPLASQGISSLWRSW